VLLGGGLLQGGLGIFEIVRSTDIQVSDIPCPKSLVVVLGIIFHGLESHLRHFVGVHGCSSLQMLFVAMLIVRSIDAGNTIFHRVQHGIAICVRHESVFCKRHGRLVQEIIVVLVLMRIAHFVNDSDKVQG
jgi:hypothetical protein